MHRRCDYGAVIRDTLTNNCARADFDPIADSNTPNKHRTCADEYIISDDRCFFMHFADGYILINTAVRADFGISGNENAVQSVRQGRTAFDDGIRPDVSAVPMRTAIAKKQKELVHERIACVLL